MKLPQLNLRDLFWLVVVAALALAWWRGVQQPVAPAAPPIGRWQLLIGKGGEELLIDTTTGTIWEYQPHNGNWFKRSPPKAP